MPIPRSENQTNPTEIRSLDNPMDPAGASKRKGNVMELHTMGQKQAPQVPGGEVLGASTNRALVVDLGPGSSTQANTGITGGPDVRIVSVGQVEQAQRKANFVATANQTIDRSIEELLTNVRQSGDDGGIARPAILGLIAQQFGRSIQLHTPRTENQVPDKSVPLETGQFEAAGLIETSPENTWKQPAQLYSVKNGDGFQYFALHPGKNELIRLPGNGADAVLHFMNYQDHPEAYSLDRNQLSLNVSHPGRENPIAAMRQNLANALGEKIQGEVLPLLKSAIDKHTDRKVSLPKAIAGAVGMVSAVSVPAFAPSFWYAESLQKADLNPDVRSLVNALAINAIQAFTQEIPLPNKTFGEAVRDWLGGYPFGLAQQAVNKLGKAGAQALSNLHDSALVMAGFGIAQGILQAGWPPGQGGGAGNGTDLAANHTLMGGNGTLNGTSLSAVDSSGGNSWEGPLKGMMLVPVGGSIIMGALLGLNQYLGSRDTRLKAYSVEDNQKMDKALDDAFRKIGQDPRFGEMESSPRDMKSKFVKFLRRTAFKTASFISAEKIMASTSLGTDKPSAADAAFLNGFLNVGGLLGLWWAFQTTADQGWDIISDLYFAAQPAGEGPQPDTDKATLAANALGNLLSRGEINEDRSLKLIVHLALESGVFGDLKVNIVEQNAKPELLSPEDAAGRNRGAESDSIQLGPQGDGHVANMIVDQGYVYMEDGSDRVAMPSDGKAVWHFLKAATNPEYLDVLKIGAENFDELDNAQGLDALRAQVGTHWAKAENADSLRNHASVLKDDLYKLGEQILYRAKGPDQAGQV